MLKISELLFDTEQIEVANKLSVMLINHRVNVLAVRWARKSNFLILVAQT